MKYIFLNLKRFDIPSALHGVNSIAEIHEWAPYIIFEIQNRMPSQITNNKNICLPIFFPEAHILPAIQTIKKTHNSYIEIGCQSVFRSDVAPLGNFGAFTSNRPPSSAKALGCTWTIIGHSEERLDKLELMTEAGASAKEAKAALSRILRKEIESAQKAGLRVLYCIGETAEEKENRKDIFSAQLEDTLHGIDISNLILAYEPVWAIGPGKTPPSAEEIEERAQCIKSIKNLPLVYGGGLKKENAASIAAIKQLDGGLIALTRFTDAIGFYPDEYVNIVTTYEANIANK